MIHVYADASMDKPVLSCGYVLTRTQHGSESFVDAGCRILHTEETHPEVEWCASRGEYRALITGVRAALDYTTHPVMVYSDNDNVVESIQGRWDNYESYFQHALMSFLGRFEDWHITNIDRERNEIAHEQARVGLHMGRDLIDSFEQ